MLTFSESRQRTLNTPDEIAAYLGEAFRNMQEASTFKTGDEVAITSRSGLPPEIGVGDVGVMLCDHGEGAPPSAAGHVDQSDIDALFD